MIHDPGSVSLPGEGSSPITPPTSRHTTGGKTYTFTKGKDREERTFEDAKKLLESVHADDPQAVKIALEKLQRGRPVKVGDVTIASASKATQAWARSATSASRKPSDLSSKQEATTAKEVSSKLKAAIATIPTTRSRESRNRDIARFVAEGLRLQDSLFYDPQKKSELEKFRNELHDIFVNAAANGDKEVVKALIQGGAAKDKFDSRRKFIDERVLHAALENGHTEVASLLFTNGADMSMGLRKDTDALFAAAERAEATRDYRLVKLMISKGFKCNAHEINTFILNAADRDRPLPRLVKVLIEAFQEKTGGYPAYEKKPMLAFENLFRAASRGHYEVVRVFIDACSDKQLLSGFLDRAIEGGNPKLVELLIAKDPPKEPKDIARLLEGAVKAHKPEVVNVLVERLVTFGNLPELLVRIKDYVGDKDHAKQIEEKLVEKFVKAGNKASMLVACESFIERTFTKSIEKRRELSHIRNLLK